LYFQVHAFRRLDRYRWGTEDGTCRALAYRTAFVGGETELPMTDESATTAQLRHDIDSGRTGSKVNFPDPAAAPLGTDDEAAGTPPSAEAVGIARRHGRSASNRRSREPGRLGCGRRDLRWNIGRHGCHLSGPSFVDERLAAGPDGDHGEGRVPVPGGPVFTP
jgi:hypothetical protein